MHRGIDTLPHINLPEESYEIARRRAAEAGFASVQEYVVDLLQRDLEVENFDHLFTPERLAQIDRAVADEEAGLGIPLEEFDGLAEFKDQWQQRNK